MIFKHLI